MDADGIEKAVSDDGFFFIRDPEVGRRADIFAGNGYPFQTEEGLDLVTATLSDSVRSDIRMVTSLLSNAS